MLTEIKLPTSRDGGLSNSEHQQAADDQPPSSANLKLSSNIKVPKGTK